VIDQRYEPGTAHQGPPRCLEERTSKWRNSLLFKECAMKLQVAVFVSDDLQHRVSQSARRETRRDEPVEAQPDDLRRQQYQYLEAQAEQSATRYE
jgi:hypothetical protein